MVMSKFSDDLSGRLMKLIAGIVQLEDHMKRKFSTQHIFRQLIRSGNSAGANYEEARAGAITVDFIYKMQIVLKELRETIYWLTLLKETKLTLKESETNLLIAESKELANIIAKFIFTSKSRLNNRIRTVKN